MPSVYVRRDLILAKVTSDKRPVTTDDEFSKVCFEFGIENDGIVLESKIKSNTDTPERPYYKIDVPANRYDLLCFEGIARSLRVFLKLEEPPVYKVVPPAQQLKLVQSPETLAIRPFVAAAVLRGVTMTETVYASFIDLQDKLHFNIGRRRTLVAIGTHDLDLIQGPFTYTAEPYDAIAFTALNESKKTDVNELFQSYRDAKSHHLKPYLDIAADAQAASRPGQAPLHPVIRDARGEVLSLPPVINSDYSKISLNTRNIFIECTGTDFTKLNIVLNTIIAMFAGYAEKPFTVEPVLVSAPASLPLPPATTVVRAPGSEAVTETLELSFPNLGEKVFQTSTAYLNSGLGLALSAGEIAPLLRAMQLDAVVVDEANGGVSAAMAALTAGASGALELVTSDTAAAKSAGSETLLVRAPVTRTDVLHPIDIQEDVAIAYGYDNLVASLPPTATVGGETGINALTDKIRERVATRYTEVMTWVLVQKEENTVKLQRPDTGSQVLLANSKTDFTACRTTLIPGLLKVVEANQVCAR